MKKSVKKRILILPAVILIAFIFFKGGASGQDDQLETKRDFYHEMESIYREALDNVLEKKGIHDAGITITSVIDIRGDRTYTVSIHHTRLSNMEPDEREQFIEEMGRLSFTDGVTPVIYEIYL